MGAAASLKIEITGVQGDALTNVEARLTELYENKSFTDDPPEAVKRQIAEALHPFGYFKPTIKILHLSQNHLSAFVSPGPQLTITNLVVELKGEGAENARIQKVAHLLPIKSGQPFVNTHYEKAKDQLFDAAEHEGYLHAAFEKAEVLINRKQNSVQITLIFNTGPQYLFGQVRFDPTYISPDLLRRYIPFKPGQPYSTEEILAFESNLTSSGYFKSVVVKPNIDSVRQVPIDVHLERVHRINYTLGVGYGTDTGPRGRAAVQVVPVTRTGHKFNAIVQGSTKENALLAQYVIPGKNPITDKFTINGSASNLNYNAGYGNSLLLSLAQQHVKKNYQRILSLNALTERFNYTGTPKTTTSMLYPQGSFTWSKTTDPLFSPSGFNVTLTGFAASKALLSDINAAQAILDAKLAITFDYIRTRFYLHGIQGFTATNDIYDVPLSLAMLLGGAENLRAYSFNAVGPGKIMTYGGIEVQKETYEKWYLIGFYDVGDVYQPSPQQWQYDVGAGLMWVSPVGPIKIAVAQAVNSRFQRIEHRNPKLVINMGPDL